MKTVELYYTDNTSDKVYFVWIKPIGSLFDVKFLYGRRGNKSLVWRNKNESPLTFDAAKNLFDKTIQSKAKKGYTTNVNGIPFGGVFNNHVSTSNKPSKTKKPTASKKAVALMKKSAALPSAIMSWC